MHPAVARLDIYIYRRTLIDNLNILRLFVISNVYMYIYIYTHNVLLTFR